MIHDVEERGGREARESLLLQRRRRELRRICGMGCLGDVSRTRPGEEHGFGYDMVDYGS